MILGLLRQQRYLCDDSRIREVKAESVRTSAAYVLFYRRVGEAEVAATVAAEEEEGAVPTEPDQYMQLDSEAIQHLELVRNNEDGTERGTVRACVRACVREWDARVNV